MSMRQLKITKSITNRESPSLEKYLQEIGKVELLGIEDEVKLAQQIRQGSQIALDKFCLSKLLWSSLLLITATERPPEPERDFAMQGNALGFPSPTGSVHGNGRFKSSSKFAVFNLSNPTSRVSELAITTPAPASLRSVFAL